MGFLIFFGVLIWWVGTITPGTLVILIGGILLLPWTAFLVPFLGVWYILFLEEK